jgi:NLI interacting factor-like phosphatase/BRCA1 C Terminus (BRCT) domain
MSDTPCEITMPVGYKLFCWKVQNGSSVRGGETIALAVPEADVSATITTPCASTVSQHKRPSRRRRPEPAGEVKTTIDSANLGNSTSKPLVATAGASIGGGERSSAYTTSSILKQDKQVAIVAKADGIVRMDIPTTTLQQKANGEIIGYIEECQHPTIIEGMCAVCGTKPGTMSDSVPSISKFPSESEQLKAATASSMSRMTVSGLTVSVSEAEGRRMARQDSLRLQKMHKLSLVLDLDHTLVHATADTRAQQHLHSRDDVRSLVLPVVAIEPQVQPQQLQRAPPQQLQRAPPQQQQQVWFQRHFVKLRPHVKEFFENAMERYEIGVYTAGTREYAEQITILIARHLVGARFDQVELEHLRQQVARAEHLYQREQQALNCIHNEKKDETTAEQLTALKNVEPTVEAINGVEPMEAVETTSKADIRTDEKNQAAGKKRKRVTFGETPPSIKVDQISKEDVESLRAELLEADRFEQKALDLRQKLFGSRVVSRTEVGDLGRDVKSLKRIFPCGGSMAAVIDDREDVWANAEDIKSTRRGEPPENLLLVRPYHWNSFLGFADVNNASGTVFWGQDVTVESESDEQLLWTADILKRLHHRYYSYDGPDRPSVPEILEKMRGEVLAGCQLVLSGLIPLHKQTPDPNMPRPPFVRYAESLGSTVLPLVTESVTHVVATKDGTDKILAGRRVKGCHIVKASWLIECVWSLTRRDETQHLLGPAPAVASSASNGALRRSAQPEVTNGVQPFADSTRDNTSSSSSDDDDDDFAADLENEFMRDGGGAS